MIKLIENIIVKKTQVLKKNSACQLWSHIHKTTNVKSNIFTQHLNLLNIVVDVNLGQHNLPKISRNARPNNNKL